MLPIVLALAAAGLRSAAIDVVVGSDGARVTARYQLDQPSAPGFVLIRLPGQAIVDLAGDVTSVEPAAGLVRIGSRVGTATIELRYRVTGDPSRIPLPVPSTPSARNTRAVSLTLIGLPPDAPLGDFFPRFAPENGRATARLGNVPSLIRVAPPGEWSPIRWLDGLVLALIVAAAVAAVARARRGAPA